MNSVCRLCGGTCHLLNLFPSRINEITELLRYVILLASSIEIKADDIVSKMVCQRCCEIAIKLHRYRTNALSNDKILKEQFTPLSIRSNGYNEEKVPTSNIQISRNLVTNDTIGYVNGIAKFDRAPSASLQTVTSAINNNVSQTSITDLEIIKKKLAPKPKIIPRVKYKHPSIKNLEKNNPNIIIPEGVFAEHVSPVISLDEAEVTDWFETQLLNMQKKLSHITIKKVTTNTNVSTDNSSSSVHITSKEAGINNKTEKCTLFDKPATNSTNQTFQNLIATNKPTKHIITNSNSQKNILHDKKIVDRPKKYKEVEKCIIKPVNDSWAIFTSKENETNSSDTVNGTVQHPSTNVTQKNTSTLNDADVSDDDNFDHYDSFDNFDNHSYVIEQDSFSKFSIRKRLKKLDEFFSDGTKSNNKSSSSSLNKSSHSRKSSIKSNSSSIDETLDTVIRNSLQLQLISEQENKLSLRTESSSSSSHDIVQKQKSFSNLDNKVEVSKNRVGLTARNQTEIVPRDSGIKEIKKHDEFFLHPSAIEGTTSNIVQRAKKRTAKQAQLSTSQSTSSSKPLTVEKVKRKNRKYYNEDLLTDFNDLELELLNDISSNASDSENIDSILQSSSNQTDVDSLFVLTSGKTLPVFICAVCSLVCDTKRQLIDHERTHLTCKFCKKRIKNLQLLVEHLNDTCVINILKDDARVQLVRVDDIPSIVDKYQDAFSAEIVDNQFVGSDMDIDNDIDNSVKQESMFNECEEEVDVKIEQHELKYEPIEEEVVDIVCISDDSDDEIEFSVVPRHTIVDADEKDDDVKIIEPNSCDEIYVFDSAFKQISSETDMIKTLFKKYYHGLIKFEKAAQTFKNTNRCVKRTSNNIIFLDRMYSELLIYTVPVSLESRPNISARFMPPVTPPATRPLEYWGHKKTIDIKKCVKSSAKQTSASTTPSIKTDSTVNTPVVSLPSTTSAPSQITSPLPIVSTIQNELQVSSTTITSSPQLIITSDALVTNSLNNVSLSFITTPSPSTVVNTANSLVTEDTNVVATASPNQFSLVPTNAVIQTLNSSSTSTPVLNNNVNQLNNIVLVAPDLLQTSTQPIITSISSNSNLVSPALSLTLPTFTLSNSLSDPIEKDSGSKV